MLKSVLDKLDGLGEDVKKEYTEKDGMFYLQVEGVDGLELADVGGLRTVLDEVKAERNQLKSTEKDLTDLLSKSKVRVSELEASTDGKSKDAIEKLKADMQELHQKELAAGSEREKALKTELETEKVESKLSAALVTAGVRPERLDAAMRIARGSAKMVEVNGSHIVQIFDDKDVVRSGKDGRDMLMPEFAEGQKETFPEFFLGSEQGGGGTPPGGGDKGGGGGGDLKKMKQSDFDALSFDKQNELMPLDEKTGTVTPTVDIIPD